MEEAMPHTITACPNCGSNDLYMTRANSCGSDGPNLLPGLGGWFSSAQFQVVACADCGLTRYFIEPEALAKLRESSRWNRCDPYPANFGEPRD
jgi:hypothetical protein